MVELPLEWFAESDGSWNGDPREAVIEGLRPWGAVFQALHRVPAGTTESLEQALAETLYGEAKHAVLSYPTDVPAAKATACLAAWLGLSSRAMSAEMGGHVSVVTSGVGHRHDQAWHTDSTPWSIPNRWTILGSLTQAEGDAPPPTGILPIGRVATAIAAATPDALVRLRSTPFEWRANFTNFDSLCSPILDAVIPRWVQPIIQEQIHDRTAEEEEMIRQFEQTLNAVESETAVVKQGQVVVFDNYAALHRGPPLDETSGRQLIRIKVGGAPV